jgi:two-component system response regulator PilR (NtrC family)
MGKILVVDDEPKMRHLLSMMIEGHGYTVDQAADGRAALEKVLKDSYDIVITDIKMPHMDGATLLSRIRGEELTCAVIFVTAFATVESAVEAMRKGAVDYITKPYEEERIVLSIERAMKMSKILKENQELKTALSRTPRDNEIIHASPSMASVMDLINRVAESESAVLITGESGTGKELIAKHIHRRSPRARGRFVPVNCAAITHSLLESELFGHEKGAFTGADRRKTGKFEYAAGGTLFLDEIGDLSLEAQAKLLRALQEKKVQRVGGNDEIEVDVRVICATNKNLEEQVAQNDFRQDLFYRINVFPIHPPPLRERREDILPLADYFLKKFHGGADYPLLSAAARDILTAYDWPGNVRELAKAMERSLILAKGREEIHGQMLSFLKSTAPVASGGSAFELPEKGISLEEMEKKLVRQALKNSDGNQTAAARLLGLSRAKFRVLMKQI